MRFGYTICAVTLAVLGPLCYANALFFCEYILTDACVYASVFVCICVYAYIC